MPGMRISRRYPSTLALAATVLWSLMPARADADLFGWGEPRPTEPVTLVIENNAKGGCWKDPDAFRGGVTRWLEDFDIVVADRSQANRSQANRSQANQSRANRTTESRGAAGTSLIVSALGHPTNNPVYSRRLGCVGVLSIRVSSIRRSTETGYAAEPIFDDQRLLVADHHLDRTLTYNARELIRQFSLKYSRVFE